MAQSLQLYGLGVRVNVPIEALAGAHPSERHDVDLSLGMDPPHADEGCAWSDYYLSSERDARGVHHIRVSRRSRPDRFRFDYEDGTRVHVDADGARVWARGPAGATHEDTATYLLGPTLGFVLQLRGVTCLHACAVAIGGAAVAIVGAGGSGQSSTAAALARRGHAVLADDLAALVDHGDSFSVRSAYPRIRLWPASVRALFGDEAALPRITPSWDKRFLALDAGPYRFQRDDLPLKAIYVLGERQSNAAPRIEPMGSRDAFMHMVANTYSNYLLDKPMRAREFEVLSRLVHRVPVRRALPSADFARIDALCEAIEGDV